MADFITFGNQTPIIKPLISVNPYNGRTGKYITTDYSDPNLPYDVRYARNRDREPGNFVTYALDLLSRGQYASATFTDTILSQGLGSIGSAFENAASEVISPSARLSYSDILERYAPEFTKNYGKTAFVLGLAGDIFLDPTTYIGAGIIGKGKKIGTTVLNETGEKVFKEVLEFEAKRVAMEFGKSTADDLVRQTAALYFKSNEALTVARSSDAIMANILKNADYAAKKLTELGLDDLIEKGLTKDKGLRIYLGLGKKEAELPVYKVLNPILEITGLNNTTQKLSDLSGFVYNKVTPNFIKEKEPITKALAFKDRLKTLFVVDDSIREDFKYFENFNSNVLDQTVRDIMQVKQFGDKAVDMEKVSKALFETSRSVENTKNIRGFLDVKEQSFIRNTVFTDLNLTKEEKQLTMVIQQKLNDIAFVDYSADILKERILNFDKGVNEVVQNADDFIRYKQALLDGTANDFIANNKELQNKIFSLESVGKALGNQDLTKSGAKVKYGQKVLEFNADTIKGISELTNNNSFSTVKNLKENKNIIEGLAPKADVKRIEQKLLDSGFQEVELSLKSKKNIGIVAKEDGSIYRQTAYKAKDGSIIRIIKEESNQLVKADYILNGKRKIGIPEKAEKFTIIKSVSAPNEGFVSKFIGEEKKFQLTLDEIKNSKNVVNNVLVDPFGSVTESIYKQGEFRKLYEEASLKGTTNTNALLLYTQRAMVAQKELGKSQFETALKLTYGVTDVKDLPKNVADRLKYVGEGLYGNGLMDGSRAALEAFDKVTSIFKKGATIANPSFGLKQIIQNPIQASLGVGLNAAKVFDPRALLEGAAIVISDGTGIGKQFPDYLSNIFYKSADDKVFAAQAIEILSKKNDLQYLEKMVISRPDGLKMTGLEFIDSAYKTGVFRGSIDDLEVLQRDIVKEFDKANSSAEVGVKSFFKNILQYWKYPEQIEKFYRMSYFINGWRTGLSLDESAKLVDKTLFNYQGNLTAFERRFMKRIVPFYSFQKNAIPLIVQSFLTEQGRVATLAKVAPVANGKFFDVWNKLQGGQELSDTERYIAPGFIFQQPSVFAGRDENGKLTFNTFNNYTPFDAINLIEFDEDVPGNKGFGERFSFEKTIKKIVLSSINPYIKVATEVPLNRYLFNDRVVTESAKIGGIGKFIDMVAPNSVKELLQFESVNDPLTGELKYYINPYLAYAGQTLPGATTLNSFLRVTDDSKTYKEKALDLFLGIRNYKYDPMELGVTKVLKNKYELQELRSKFRLAIKQGRMNEAEKRLGELQQFMEYTTVEASYQSTK